MTWKSRNKNMNFLDELATSIFSFTYFVYVRINKLFDRPSETLKNNFLVELHATGCKQYNLQRVAKFKGYT